VPVKNPLTARFLIWASNTRGSAFKRLAGIILGSDVQSPLPSSTIMGHPYGIVIHSSARIGEKVTILHQVTIGGKDASTLRDVPIIGDQVTIGAGAKILGPITIGKDATIGANAVVTKDVPEGATVVGANRI